MDYFLRFVKINLQQNFGKLQTPDTTLIILYLVVNPGASDKKSNDAMKSGASSSRYLTQPRVKESKPEPWFRARSAGAKFLC